jgi:hypothetical protein
MSSSKPPPTTTSDRTGPIFGKPKLDEFLARIPELDLTDQLGLSEPLTTSGSSSVYIASMDMSDGPREDEHSISLRRVRKVLYQQHSDDKPLRNPPSDGFSPTTPMSPGHEADLLSSPSSSHSGPPPGGSSQAGPVVSKRTHALYELLSSERAYASDLAFVRDVYIPLALGEWPRSFPVACHAQMIDWISNQERLQH